MKNMKKITVAFVLVAIVALAGLGMVGKGITGMVTGNEYTKPLCTSNKDCSGSDVCCYFYGEDAGVCDIQKNCASIAVLTSNTGSGESQPMAQSEDALAGFIIGILVVAAAGLLLWTHFSDKKIAADVAEKQDS